MCHNRIQKLSHFKYTILYLFIFLQNITSSQEIIQSVIVEDTLKSMSYDELYSVIKKNRNNRKIQAYYAHHYLKRAQINKDTLYIMKGYFLSYQLNDKYKNIATLDSVIKYCRNSNVYRYPYVAYRQKGKWFYNKRNFKKALDNHLIALNLATKNNIKKDEIASMLSIALLKERIGKHKEALEIYKKCYVYKTQKIDFSKLDTINPIERNNYLNILVSLSDSYRRNKFYDSAQVYIQKLKSLKHFDKTERYTNKGRLTESEIYFEKNKYETVVDSISKAMLIFEKNGDLKNLAVAYYLRGRSHKQINRNNKAINDLSKMDSIFNILNDLSPELRAGYPILINHYKNEKNITNELYYVKQLIRLDSILHSNYAYISENLVEKFDTPKLIEDKERLEHQLKKTTNKIWYWSIGLMSIALATLFIFRLRYQKKLQEKTQEKRELEKYYREKFDRLIHQSKVKLSERQEFVENKKPAITDDIIEDVTKKLITFEKNKGFAKTDISAISLAKKFNTNQNYLSKIIKYKKNKSFRTYINDLRIDLALERLRNEPKFRNYSVAGIAKEVGFNNAEPFSKTFYQRVGMYPSDFIASLQNIKKQ